MPSLIRGEPGEVFVNRTGKILWQAICDFRRSCARCIALHHTVGPYFPFPLHDLCNCRQVPIKPGDSALPFIDYMAEVASMSPADQRHAMGASNWKLIESGKAKWEDVVTKGRIRDFREVADNLGLGVEDLRKAGVTGDQARRAYDSTHTEAHRQADSDRAAIIKGLKAHGLSDERIAAEAGNLLAKRTGLIKIGGAPDGGGPSEPEPKPKTPKKPKPGPKKEEAPQIPVNRDGVPIADLYSYRATLTEKLSGDVASDRRINAITADWLAQRAIGPVKEVQAHGMPVAEPMRAIEIQGLVFHYPTSVDPSSERPNPIVRTLVKLHNQLDRIPKPLMDSTKNVYLSSGRNTEDPYWAIRYDMEDFQSAATGGDGDVVFYNRGYARMNTLVHEMGHNFAKARFGSTKPSADSDFARATQEDGPLEDSYGNINLTEGFAVSIESQVTDPAGFAARHPARNRVLKKLLEDPSYGG